MTAITRLVLVRGALAHLLHRAPTLNIFVGYSCPVQAIVLRGIETKVKTRQHRRHESYQLANELRQSSDDMTWLARTSAITGDARYRDYYRKISKAETAH